MNRAGKYLAIFGVAMQFGMTFRYVAIAIFWVG
jgi:hypothetical protein